MCLSSFSPRSPLQSQTATIQNISPFGSNLNNSSLICHHTPVCDSLIVVIMDESLLFLNTYSIFCPCDLGMPIPLSPSFHPTALWYSYWFKLSLDVSTFIKLYWMLSLSEPQSTLNLSHGIYSILPRIEVILVCFIIILLECGVHILAELCIFCIT